MRNCPEAGYAPTRVAAGGTPALCVGDEVKHLDPDVGLAVGDGRHEVQAVVFKGEDVFVLDVRDKALAERWRDLFAEHEPLWETVRGLQCIATYSRS